jgi:hypothetical protein
MNGFLVIVRCEGHDIPVFFGRYYGEAECVAAGAVHNPDSVIEGTGSTWGYANPYAVEIIEFSNGRPLSSLKQIFFEDVEQPAGVK